MTNNRKGVDLSKFIAKKQAENTSKTSQTPQEVTSVSKEHTKAVSVIQKSLIADSSSEKKAPQAPTPRVFLPMTSENNSHKSNKGDADKLYRSATYREFQRWISLPDNVRDPKNQAEFAKKYKVSPHSLSDWKKVNGFWDAVQDEAKNEWKKELGKWIQSLHLGMMTERSPKHFEALMGYVFGYYPKSRFEDETPRQPIDEENVRLLATAMVNAGFAGVTQHHTDLAKVFLESKNKKDDKSAS